MVQSHPAILAQEPRGYSDAERPSCQSCDSEVRRTAAKRPS
jgi:hypothetical protein